MRLGSEAAEGTGGAQPGEKESPSGFAQPPDRRGQPGWGQALLSGDKAQDKRK